MKARAIRILSLASAIVLAATCSGGPQAAIEQLVESRRLAAELLLQLAKLTEAGNRTVMADSDDAAAVAVRESDAARAAIERDTTALTTRLTELEYGPEKTALSEFQKLFADLGVLDREILDLAALDTNLKAQRLSFGRAFAAADALRDAVAGVRASSAGDEWQVRALIAETISGIREIQALQAPHIAEPEDAAMTRLEERMTKAESAARSALKTLATVAQPESSRPFQQRPPAGCVHEHPRGDPQTVAAQQQRSVAGIGAGQEENARGCLRGAPPRGSRGAVEASRRADPLDRRYHLRPCIRSWSCPNNPRNGSEPSRVSPVGVVGWRDRLGRPVSIRDPRVGRSRADQAGSPRGQHAPHVLAGTCTSWRRGFPESPASRCRRRGRISGIATPYWPTSASRFAGTFERCRWAEVFPPAARCSNPGRASSRSERPSAPVRFSARAWCSFLGSARPVRRWTTRRRMARSCSY